MRRDVWDDVSDWVLLAFVFFAIGVATMVLWR